MSNAPSTTATSSAQALKATPLHALHVALGARMVPFAGYAMPVSYPSGIIAEHLHCRLQAALFDVSHMGQIRLLGGEAVPALERLVPGDIAALAPGRMRLTMFTNEAGGILDDLMATRIGGGVALVVNAARKDFDLGHLRAQLPSAIRIEPDFERALIALQGPKAAVALARLAPEARSLAFMEARAIKIDGVAAVVSRSGYTGEDGFEISLAAADAENIARALLAMAEVAPAGLGARDSLRLEAGLCLYGHDLDATTTPIEASLAWTMSKRRRAEGGFPGAAVIQRQLRDGAPRRRVGIRVDGPAPAREGAVVRDLTGAPLGKLTSGGFGPSLGAPIAMGYLAAQACAVGTALLIEVRGRDLPAKVAALPFVPSRYHKS